MQTFKQWQHIILVCLCLTYFTLIVSRSIHVDAMASFHSLYDWVIFHYMCVPFLLCLFLCQWTLRLLPYLGYCKQCNSEHWDTFIFFVLFCFFCLFFFVFFFFASTILSWLPCSIVWSQESWFLQLHSSFSRLLWLFKVFCVSIWIVKFFVLVLWKMPLAMW